MNNIVNVKAEYATCTKDGLTMGRKCSYCGYVEQAQEVIPKKGHTESDWIIDLEPTEKADGHKHKICSICSEIIEEEVIPRLGSPIKDYILPISVGAACLMTITILVIFVIKRKNKKRTV